jgi:hypothetical protein
MPVAVAQATVMVTAADRLPGTDTPEASVLQRAASRGRTATTRKPGPVGRNTGAATVPVGAAMARAGAGGAKAVAGGGGEATRARRTVGLPTVRTASASGR